MKGLILEQDTNFNWGKLYHPRTAFSIYFLFLFIEIQLYNFEVHICLSSSINSFKME